jgi:hypothetical protein
MANGKHVVVVVVVVDPSDVARTEGRGLASRVSNLPPLTFRFCIFSESLNSIDMVILFDHYSTIYSRSHFILAP